MGRSLDEQFEAPKASKIRRIAEQFRSVANVGGGIRYFALEVVQCLQAGLLLSALHVASSLLELSVRKLLINRLFAEKRSSDDEGPMLNELLNDVEHEIEDREQLGFQAIVDKLKSLSVIEEEEAEKLKTFYSDVRIPIQHGITRRFVREERNLKGEEDPLALFELDHMIRFHKFEEAIEDNSLKYLQVVSGFVSNYYG